MHLSLSDLLTCPRCGPAHGLVLMPEAVRDRRVEAGVLGCPNCRERYPIRAGVAELVVPEELTASDAPAPEGWSGEWDGEAWAVRLGGLLGLEGAARGVVLVGGPAAVGAGRLGGLVEGVEVVVVRRGGAGGGGGGGGGGETGGGIRVGAGLPVRTGSMRGVALTGWATSLAAEGLRVLAPGARLLLEPLGPGVRERVAAAGATVVLDEGDTLVVMRGV
jgi:uncharacterized protein YbaR (Trm112 family)